MEVDMGIFPIADTDSRNYNFAMAFMNYSAAEFLAVIFSIIIGFTVHEAAHGLVALRLGDDSAKRNGRVSLNPLNHIDPMGAIMLLVAGFGWARPVGVDITKLKQPYRDEVLISLAGPLSNLLLAFAAVIVFKGIVGAVAADGFTAVAARSVAPGLLIFINVNLGLGVFNLFPIPPLDGSHLITARMRQSNPVRAAKFAHYGAYFFIGILAIEALTPRRILPVRPIVNAVFEWMFGIVS